MQPESLILLVLLGGMLLLLFNRSRRAQREAQSLQSQLTVGSRIMTTAGLHATVVALDDTVVTLETGPGQQSRWDRRAVARVLPEESPAEAGATEEDLSAEGLAETTPHVTAEHDVTSPDAAPPERA